MKRLFLLVLVLLFMDSLLQVESKRSWGGSTSGRRGSSRGKSNTGSSSSSTSSWGFFTSKTQQRASAPPAPKPAAPAPGWSNPNAAKPASGYGWVNPSQAKPAASSSGFTNPSQAKPAATNTGFVNPSQTKPGFVNPSQAKANQPSSNIGPGGYPVQSGVQAQPPPYPGSANMKPASYPAQPPAYTPNANARPPQYSPQLPAGHSSYNPTQRVNPPAYSPTNPHSYNAPSYNAPKKVTVNNHYHYNSPSNGGYQSSFGYPAGNNYNSGYRPSYNGMGLFSSGHNSYGYPGSGSWGVPSYGSGGSGSMTKGLLIGAAGGYLASSLVHKISNPWGYSGSGYGSGYMHGYRDYMRHQAISSAATPAPVAAGVTQAPPPANDWINCVAFDPSTNTTLINPNCTCTVTVITDPATGLNQSYHDCTPYGMTTPSPYIRVPQAPSLGQAPPLGQAQPPVYGVDNPPPSFNGTMYAPGSVYGSYGMPVQEGTVQSTVAAAGVASAATIPETSGQSTPTPPVTEAQIGHASSIIEKRNEVYSQLEQIVNMGRFRN